MKETKDVIQEIQQTKLTWIATKKDPSFFEVIFAGEHIQLRLNDFPDEPMMTLFVRDEEITLEEAPPSKIWHLQH